MYPPPRLVIRPNKTFLRLLGSPAIEDTIAREVNDLNHTVNEDVKRFDARRFSDKEGNTLKLHPRWQALYDTFNRLMNKSYEDATAATAFMKGDSYTAVISDDVAPSEYPDLKIELREFMKKLELKDGMAMQTQGAFAKLADNVRLFVVDIDESLFKAENGVITELDRLRSRIEALQAELAKIRNKMKRVGIKCLSSFAIGVAAIGACIVSLSPDAIFLALTSMITAIQSGVEVYKLTADSMIHTVRPGDGDINIGTVTLHNKRSSDELMGPEQTSEEAGIAQSVTCAFATVASNLLSTSKSRSALVLVLAALYGICGSVLVLGSGSSASLCLARFLCLLLSWYLWLGASGFASLGYAWLHPRSGSYLTADVFMSHTVSTQDEYMHCLYGVYNSLPGLAHVPVLVAVMYNHWVKTTQTRVHSDSVLDIKKQLKMCEDNYEMMHTQEGALHDSTRALNDAKTDIKQLAMKIDTIGGFGRRVDIRDFMEQLDLATDPEASITRFFPKKIAATREVYRKLIFLLEEYTKGSVNATHS
ncbi:hypothetical protein C8Q74DRAFT_1221333 [Fomes fomentarius]|nr:hypothetical protein C8Q74DRAFT_1221333 [Fomes fomentarius]